MKNGGILSQARNFIADAGREYPVEFAYIFGSQARGAENTGSDIDLALYFTKDYPKMEETLIRGYLIEMGKRYFTMQADIISLRCADLFLKYAVVKEGILIKDSDSDSRADFESLTLREYFDFQYYSDFYNSAMIASIKEQTYFGANHG
ncbi:MAG: type VII toxin-antitoxin system MntA family adenylyltransferase antitoxin [Bacteroidota bacterium]